MTFFCSPVLDVTGVAFQSILLIEMNKPGVLLTLQKSLTKVSIISLVVAATDRVRVV